MGGSEADADSEQGTLKLDLEVTVTQLVVDVVTAFEIGVAASVLERVEPSAAGWLKQDLNHRQVAHWDMI